MKLAILGMGLMGQAAAERLLAQDHEVTVWNRSPIKPFADNLEPIIAASADEAAATSPAILLFLSDAAAIEAVLDNISDDTLSGKTLIQMGTISPQQSREFEDWCHQHNAGWLEAPVLGSLPETRNGTLLIMAAGDQTIYEKQLPLLQVLGKAPRYIGPAGQAAALKLALNQLIAGLTATFSLSLGLVQKENVDVEQFMSILRESALYAPTFDKKLGKMLARDFANPNFPLKHLLKDVSLFLEAAAPHQLDDAALQGVKNILLRAQNADLADEDYSALYQQVVPEQSPS